MLSVYYFIAQLRAMYLCLHTHVVCVPPDSSYALFSGIAANFPNPTATSLFVVMPLFVFLQFPQFGDSLLQNTVLLLSSEKLLKKNPTFVLLRIIHFHSCVWPTKIFLQFRACVKVSVVLHHGLDYTSVYVGSTGYQLVLLRSPVGITCRSL